MKEFLGIGGYQRTSEGAYSWQHLLFVFSLMALMIGLAVFLGLRNRKRSDETKNRVLIVAAILIDCLEIFKITVLCIRESDAWGTILRNLPLYMCSIQLITLPLAAFAKGRLKSAAIDFVFIFGILGAVFGTIGAAQNYNAYPVLSLDNVFSGVTHCISGFASLYLAISGMLKMEKRNIPITFGIISGFFLVALIVNYALTPNDPNYMFVMRDDGTPYKIFYNLFGQSFVYQTFLYPVIVLALFYLAIAAFYGVYFLIQKLRARKAAH